MSEIKLEKTSFGLKMYLNQIDTGKMVRYLLLSNCVE